MRTPQFILASASPARRRLLEIAGIDAIVRPSNFDESQVHIADPEALVQALAVNKATAVAADIAATTTTLILGCDSVLAINGEIHGKPASAEEAIARWQQMRGQVGSLYTGHALIVVPPTGEQGGEGAGAAGAAEEAGAGEEAGEMPLLTASLKTLVRCQVTQVHFAAVSDRQIAAYVATGEPLHCAGCFALEGKGGLFVEKIEGCHSNVIGLSLPLLRQMLDHIGYDVTDFWLSA